MSKAQLKKATITVIDGAYKDKVITVLFNEGLLTDRVVNLDQDEADALAALADAGLVPQLRLVPPSADTVTRAAAATMAKSEVRRTISWNDHP